MSRRVGGPALEISARSLVVHGLLWAGACAVWASTSVVVHAVARAVTDAVRAVWG